MRVFFLFLQKRRIYSFLSYLKQVRLNFLIWSSSIGSLSWFQVTDSSVSLSVGISSFSSCLLISSLQNSQMILSRYVSIISIFNSVSVFIEFAIIIRSWSRKCSPWNIKAFVVWSLSSDLKAKFNIFVMYSWISILFLFRLNNFSIVVSVGFESMNLSRNVFLNSWYIENVSFPFLFTWVDIHLATVPCNSDDT